MDFQVRQVRRIEIMDGPESPSDRFDHTSNQEFGHSVFEGF